jgi:hypothetical protein
MSTNESFNHQMSGGANPPHTYGDWLKAEREYIPTLDELVHGQDLLAQSQRTWLDRCRQLAAFRVPTQLLDRVPESVWRAPVWGHKLLVLHAPPVKQAGLIVIPEQHRTTASYGWVLVVGRDVCSSESRQAPSGGGSVCPYGDPLLLVGQFVLFQLHAVREITFTVAGGGYQRAKKDDIQVSMLMVGDVWLPVIDQRVSDWSDEQPAVDSSLVLPS